VSALLLATRQGGDHARMEVAQIDLGQHRIDELVDLPPAPVSGAHAHDLRHREGKGDADALRQHCAVTGERGRAVRRERAALQADDACTRDEIAGQDAQQRRFAGAVRADERRYLARGER
jgi:hypothetical protein